jgi:transcriptional regulator with XRE-family HTH domain
MDILKTIRNEINKSGQSRYRIAKDTGIDQGQIHRIMEKNQSLYCETAEKLLEYFGYEITKKGSTNGKRGTKKD